MLEVGAVAPEIALRDGAGNTVRPLEGPRGPVLLVFFKVSCPTCQFTFPFLKRLADGAPGLRVVPVSQDRAAGTEAFVRQFVPGMPVWFDAPWAYAASTAFGIHHVPSLFLVEEDGRISQAGYGFSRGDLTELGARFGLEVFRESERVPEFQPG